MKLIIDLGNTQQKFYVFEGKELREEYQRENKPGTSFIEELINMHGPFCSAILSSVVHTSEEITKVLESGCNIITLDHNTNIPIKIRYESPETLGADRIALAVAANSYFPDDNVLIIDAGTCITYDFVNKHGEYLGGSIAPGLRIKFEALHDYTSKLPMVEIPEEEVELIGKNTKESILSGVLKNTRFEMQGVIDAYDSKFKDLKIILSGGDSKFFDKRLKNSIFAVPNAVAVGLNEILDFNEQ